MDLRNPWIALCKTWIAHCLRNPGIALAVRSDRFRSRDSPRELLLCNEYRSRPSVLRQLYSAELHGNDKGWERCAAIVTKLWFRPIHVLRKSELCAFHTAQSMDCRTKHGSMLCAGESAVDLSLELALNVTQQGMGSLTAC